MADIQLRFGKDVLVIGPQVQVQLANPPADDEDLLKAADAFDTEFSLLFEPEIFEESYLLQKLAGAQCLVTPTASLTPARLAHTGMQDAAAQLASTAVSVVTAQTPEHVLVEIGPCGLPLDASSKASLLENRRQYERAAQLFAEETFDAFFLNGFTRVVDLKCALMGIRKVSDAPILASADVDAGGFLRPRTDALHPANTGEALEDAVAVMAECGAQVAGFAVHGEISAAVELAKRVQAAAYMPVLAQLVVGDGVMAEPDEAFSAAEALAVAGVQFVRACGEATPAYTGAMVAAVGDLPVRGVGSEDTAARGAFAEEMFASEEELDALAARLRDAVNSALKINGASEGESQ